MASDLLRLWCILEGGTPFTISISSSASIYDLKEQIHQKCSTSLTCDAWQLNLTKVDADFDDENVQSTTSARGTSAGQYRPDANDKFLRETKEIRDVWREQPHNNHLHVFASLPSGMCPPTLGSEVRNVELSQYSKIFVRVNKWGSFEFSDIERNQIVEESTTVIPEFVTAFEQNLVRKPRVCRDTVLEISQEISQNLKYFELSEDPIAEAREDPILEDESHEETRYAERFEVMHTSFYIALYDWKIFWQAEGGSPFNGRVANTLLFDPLIHAPKDESASAVENKSLPITLIVERGHGQLREFNPRPDFHISISKLPRLLVELEVNSTSENSWPVDLIQMLTTGAFIVRFANTFVSAFGQKNFVLCAFFIWGNGDVTRYTLFQKRENDMVYYRKMQLSLNNTDGRADFTRHLYNLLYIGLDPGKNQNTNGAVEGLNQIVKKRNMRSMFSTANNALGKRAREGDSGHAGSGDAGSGHGHAQLRAHGYEVKSKVTVYAGGGSWHTIGKTPDHILTVYRPKDPNKELIAKKTREESHELEMFRLLEAIPRKSDHVISLIDSFHGWAILPKMISVRRYVDSPHGVSESEVSQLCSGLIEGLAYLHGHCIAHRDIKPDNLVVEENDKNTCLKIIDFDTAMQVEDEDEEVDDQCGTEGWIAPEVEKKLKHSPIRADRWACGQVLLLLLRVFKKEDNFMRAFATKLTAHNPKQRPSLLDWSRYSAPPIRNAGNVRNVEVGVVVNGENAKPPSAKRKKLSDNDEDNERVFAL